MDHLAPPLTKGVKGGSKNWDKILHWPLEEENEDKDKDQDQDQDQETPWKAMVESELRKKQR